MSQPSRTTTVPAGVAPLLDAAADLAWRKDHADNSWFATARFEAAGEMIDCLIHILFIPVPGGHFMAQGGLAITNETAGWHRADAMVLPLEQVKIGTQTLDIAMPIAHMAGTLDDLQVQARLPDGSATIDLHLSNTSPIIFNGGAGVFPMLGVTIHQYSVPRMKACGSITLDGRELAVEGTGWFDRQWQNDLNQAHLKWSWMGLNLGDTCISLWSAPATPGGEERAWATILHADGSQSVAAVEPGLGATDIWRSPTTGASFPTCWTVRIPAMDAVLEVVPAPREQEIVVKQVPAFCWYEGASIVTGTWRGRPAKGFGFVELAGNWK